VALNLWAERGFETGVEDTTIDEIVQAAGVTKGTFYFHFAHKEDILLELGWGTAEALYAEAIRGVRTGGPGLALLQRLLKSLARRTESLSRASVHKYMTAFYAHGVSANAGRLEIQRAFEVVLEAARDGGELPEDTDVKEVADVITAVTLDAVRRWAGGDRRQLGPVLQRRVNVVLEGMLPGPVIPASKRRAAPR